MKIGTKIFLGFAGVILMALFYYFPLQYIMAEIKFTSYAREAGIEKSDIANKELLKDYKQDGYYINVTYTCDSEHVYEYRYFLLDMKKDGTQFHRMYYTVYNMRNEISGYHLPFEPPEQKRKDDVK